MTRFRFPARWGTCSLAVTLAVAVSGCGARPMALDAAIRAAAVAVVLQGSDVETVASAVICISLRSGTGQVGGEVAAAPPPAEEVVQEVVDVLGSHDPPFRTAQNCGEYPVGLAPAGSEGRAVTVTVWEASIATTDSLAFAVDYYVGPLHARGHYCVVARADRPQSPRCGPTWIS